MKIFRIIALIPLLVASPATVSAADIQRSLIQNRGSDSMAIAVERWAEQYKRYDTTIGVAVSGGGTGTGIAALINGTVDIANASRAMTRREINLAKERGIVPVQHIIGYDGQSSQISQLFPAHRHLWQWRKSRIVDRSWY